MVTWGGRTVKVDLRHPARNGEIAEAVQEIIRGLVAARYEAGLTQTEVAFGMGTSQSTVAKIEQLRHEPKVGTLMRYAEIVGYNVTLQKRGTRNAQDEPPDSAPAS